MVIYTCDLCSKNYNNKTKYTQHINRKFPCCPTYQTHKKPQIAPYSPDKAPKLGLATQHTTLNNTIPQHTTLNNTVPQHTTLNNTVPQHTTLNNTIPQHKKNICINCGKEFYKKYGLNRHIQLNRCKNILQITQDDLNNLIKQNQELNKKINSLIKKNTNTNTTITNNSNNITNSNNTTNNNITNNNYIIQFGHEYKTEGLTNDEIMKVINRGCNALCESIKLTHFNTRLPQLHNIYIPDKKFRTISIFNNNIFELNKIDDVLHGLIDNHINKLKKYLKMDLPYENNKTGIVNQLLKKINVVYDDDNSLKFKNDENISEIMYYLYNNRNMVIKHYEKYFKEISKL
jgi:hypothetical protein